MNWSLLIPIIAQYGIPLAEKLFQKWTSGNPPTQADFDELRLEASNTSTDRMKNALVTAGIPLTDPRAVTFLDLVKAR